MKTYGDFNSKGLRPFSKNINDEFRGYGIWPFSKDEPEWIGTDYEIGVQALRYFHTMAENDYPENMQVNFQDFISIINGQNKSFIAGLGMGIKLVPLSKSNVENSMEWMAEASRGKMPANPQDFRAAIVTGSRNFNWSEYIKASGQDLIKFASEVGVGIKEGVTGASQLLSYSKYLIPVLLAVGIVAVVKIYGSPLKLLKKR